jgi:hypothetical protein
MPTTSVQSEVQPPQQVSGSLCNNNNNNNGFAAPYAKFPVPTSNN